MGTDEILEFDFSTTKDTKPVIRPYSRYQKFRLLDLLYDFSGIAVTFFLQLIKIEPFKRMTAGDIPMSENKRSILMRFLSGALPLLLVLYVLSIGPVFGYLLTPSGLRDDVSSETLERIESFYAPVTWAVNNNDFLLSIAVKYVEFWEDIL
tara:strand:+ start:501731 stop:502183 length:453 start_codon:yes stop_codon:yes gene_type:complete